MEVQKFNSMQNKDSRNNKGYDFSDKILDHSHSGWVYVWQQTASKHNRVELCIWLLKVDVQISGKTAIPTPSFNVFFMLVLTTRAVVAGVWGRIATSRVLMNSLKVTQLLTG